MVLNYLAEIFKSKKPDKLVPDVALNIDTQGNSQGGGMPITRSAYVDLSTKKLEELWTNVDSNLMLTEQQAIDLEFILRHYLICPIYLQTLASLDTQYTITINKLSEQDAQNEAIRTAYDNKMKIEFEIIDNEIARIFPHFPTMRDLRQFIHSRLIKFGVIDLQWYIDEQGLLQIIFPQPWNILYKRLNGRWELVYRDGSEIFDIDKRFFIRQPLFPLTMGNTGPIIHRPLAELKKIWAELEIHDKTLIRNIIETRNKTQLLVGIDPLSAKKWAEGKMHEHMNLAGGERIKKENEFVDLFIKNETNALNKDHGAFAITYMKGQMEIQELKLNPQASELETQNNMIVKKLCAVMGTTVAQIGYSTGKDQATVGDMQQRQRGSMMECNQSGCDSLFHKIITLIRINMGLFKDGDIITIESKPPEIMGAIDFENARKLKLENDILEATIISGVVKTDAGVENTSKDKTNKDNQNNNTDNNTSNSASIDNNNNDNGGNN